MANIINIIEHQNRLLFEDNYTPVVCGNSNYFVVFNFSEEWSRCYQKKAIFVVGDRQKQMNFEGNVLKLPAFPNAPYFELLVYANQDNEHFSTTSIKIRLEPTPIGNLIKFK